MTRLLVSVRSAEEAETALQGGAGLIDVKEPSNGSLGMSAVSVIVEVIRLVSGRVPVSAALGEARDALDLLPKEVADRLAFVKYGAAGCGGRGRAFLELTFSSARQHLEESQSPCQVVAAAYADWQRRTRHLPTNYVS